MISSGSAVQTKGFGCWLWSATKRLMAVSFSENYIRAYSSLTNLAKSRATESELARL